MLLRAIGDTDHTDQPTRPNRCERDGSDRETTDCPTTTYCIPHTHRPATTDNQTDRQTNRQTDRQDRIAITVHPYHAASRKTIRPIDDEPTSSHLRAPLKNKTLVPNGFDAVWEFRQLLPGFNPPSVQPPLGKSQPDGRMGRVRVDGHSAKRREETRQPRYVRHGWRNQHVGVICREGSNKLATRGCASQLGGRGS